MNKYKTVMNKITKYWKYPAIFFHAAFNPIVFLSMYLIVDLLKYQPIVILHEGIRDNYRYLNYINYFSIAFSFYLLWSMIIYFIWSWLCKTKSLSHFLEEHFKFGLLSFCTIFIGYINITNWMRGINRDAFIYIYFFLLLFASMAQLFNFSLFWTNVYEKCKGDK